MPEPIKSIFRSPFQTVDDVVQKLLEFERFCLDSNDLRGIFTTAYLQITKSIHNALEEKSFNDVAWSRRYLIRFANLYREAIVAAENGRHDAVPASWKIAFRYASNREGLIIQHLLLGINAHINHDLAIALFDVGIDSDRSKKLEDHHHINKILADSTDDLKKSVTQSYAPILKRVDRLSAHISNDIANFSIPKARDHAWAFAVALTSCSSPAEETLLRKALDDQAAVLARLIMASPTQDPRFLQVVSKAKKADGWITRIHNLVRRLLRK